MGALNQKWTPEEESALKVGVLKYGTDKWRTTLKDPEYSGVLYLRSNVDLKVEFWLNIFYKINFIQCIVLQCIMFPITT